MKTSGNYLKKGNNNMNNIITVIDELGALLTKYKEELKFKDYEIERLNKKISHIEQYVSYYEETNKEEKWNKE